MKILSLWDNYAAESDAPEGVVSACWMSDSCLLRERRPFYVPDFDDDFRLFPTLAIRMSRLGKCISERFAVRYWSEASVWLNVRACTLLKRLETAGLPLAPAVAFDNSLVSAPFFPMTPEECEDFKIVVALNGEDVCLWDSRELRMKPNKAIEALSRNTTLKTGDVILMGMQPEGVMLSVGDVVEVFRISGGETGSREEVTRFNIK